MEPQLYIDAGGKAEFVGHPMAQTMPVEADRAAARQKLGVPADVPVFAILPGSRVSEIDYMAAVFFQTALLLPHEVEAIVAVLSSSDYQANSEKLRTHTERLQQRHQR